KKYDVIITNPPYVTTEAMEHLPGEYRHEPELALVAGEDGMDLIKTILEQAKEHLNDGGLMFVELGDGKEAFENRWPELNVVWLPTSGGDDQVFMIRKENLP
ncbi:Eco57I restriction-modification methylase domain-containing protein, partial [Turicimonas muris]